VEGRSGKAVFRWPASLLKSSRAVLAMLATLLPIVVFSRAMILLLEHEQDLQFRQILRYVSTTGMG